MKYDKSESALLHQVLLIPETAIGRDKHIEPRVLSRGDQVPVGKR